jgi:hypothetical protein
MADKKISALDAATTPLAGTEVLPIVQSSTTKKVSVNDLTAGKAVSVGSLASTGVVSLPAGTLTAPSLIPTGDTNTGFWFPAADTVALSSGGVEAFRVTSAYRLGVNTTAPSNALSVGSNALSTVALDWTGDNNAKASYSANHATGEVRFFAATNYFPTFYSNNAEAARVTTGGNLTLGTTAAGTSATKTLAISTGVAPTTGPADTIQIYSSDLSAGNTVLSLYTEGTPVSVNAVTEATHRIAVRINGTLYYLLANTAA